MHGRDDPQLWRQISAALLLCFMKQQLLLTKNLELTFLKFCYNSSISQLSPPASQRLSPRLHFTMHYGFLNGGQRSIRMNKLRLLLYLTLLRFIFHWYIWFCVAARSRRLEKLKCDSGKLKCDSGKLKCDSGKLKCDSGKHKCESEKPKCDSAQNRRTPWHCCIWSLIWLGQSVWRFCGVSPCFLTLCLLESLCVCSNQAEV